MRLARTPPTLIAGAILIALSGSLVAQDVVSEPVRRTVTFEGTEREYFLHLPRPVDRSKTYWPLVVVHGAGGNGRTFFVATGVARGVIKAELDAIVISPSFRNDDDNASRFPGLGEGAFLVRVMEDVRRDFRLRPKMLLTGYSRGGQFAHRYAFAHPELVEAVAPLASGTWTTPDGRLFLEEAGEVTSPRQFLSTPTNASKIPARLADLFEPRVAAVAATRASAGAERIPFLVMCGTLDPRLTIAKEFVESLQKLRYQVSAEWPHTPHSCPNPCPNDQAAEFAKYPASVVTFFVRVTKGK